MHNPQLETFLRVADAGPERGMRRMEQRPRENMVINRLDSIEFRLRQSQDFTWLKKYGTAFWAVDETGSGCICIGMDGGDKKYFCKIAGADTVEAEVSPGASVEILKRAIPIYHDLSHPNLIKLLEAYDCGPLYAAVFEWAQGESLFDHWNFEKYRGDGAVKSPKERFRDLPAGKRLKAVDVLFSFLGNAAEKGYVAVDFYDGSIMYDFSTDKTTICDIDLFRKAPVINDRGAQWFGTKRLKAPEEYIKGSPIDERTNIFTLGALIFEFLGNYSDQEIKERYAKSRFLPCSRGDWQLSAKSYEAAARAVSSDKDRRYRTFAEFYEEWKRAT